VPRVVVEDGQNAWVQETAEGQRISIGRALTNVVIIEDSAASREHCAVEADGEGKRWLIDLGSRNGTRLNGRYVTKARIEPGDRIEIGTTVITLAAPGEAGAKQAEELARELKARQEALRGEGPEALTRDPLTNLASFPAVVLELRRLLASAPSSANLTAVPGPPGATSTSHPPLPPPLAGAASGRPPPPPPPAPLPGSAATGPAARPIAGQEGSTVALIKVDIDYLGLLNDMFGLRAGDDVIVQVAQAVRAAIDADPSARALAGREAGGKFLILLPRSGPEQARAVAERIRLRVAERTLDGALREATLTCSAGIAAAPDDERTWDGLLRRAEAALAEAKRAGRDRVARPPARDGDDLPRLQALTDTRGSGLWAASEVWDPRAARGGGLPPARPTPTPGQPPAPGQVAGEATAALAPLLLDHGGQSILALVAQALGSDLELDSLLEVSLGIMVDAVKARRGFLLLREPGGSVRLRMAIDRDLPGVPVAEKAISQGILQEVLRTQSAVLVKDAQADPRFKARESIVSQGIRSVIAAPILWGKEVVGIVAADNRAAVDRFGERERDLLLAFGRLVAGPIRRQSLHQARSDELDRARLALSRTAEVETKRRHRYANIIGEAASMKKLFKLLDRLAESSHPVLIHGESGTGKELVASAIHYNGPRRKGPFIAENVAALSDSLLEAELFGHIKGAFTGADSDRVGLIEAADGGTLFLDEIGEMSERMQAKLLRVLQEGEVRPVGGRDLRKVDVRLLCATHRNLLEMARAGTFREDLYYRIAVMTVDVPPLRERKEDIPLLFEAFLRAAALQDNRPQPEITREALQLIVHHDWPGNVRELENMSKALLTLAPDRILPQHLPPKLLGGAAGDRPQSAIRRLAVSEGSDALLMLVERGRKLEECVDMFEKECITRVLGLTSGNRSETARRLGLSRPGLLKKMKRFGIE
jgi:diguanylate cyclase (GGDEF)-like protein